MKFSNRTMIVLAVLVVVFQAADIVSTYLSIANGGVESNFIMWLLMAKFGSYWWLPKLVIALFIAVYVAQQARLNWRIITIMVIAFCPAIINLTQYCFYIGGYF